MFDLSKKQWGVGRRRREWFGEGVSPFSIGGGAWRRTVPPHQKIFDFFHFKIVHFGAFLYTNSEVLFAIKCRERYMIMVFLVTDGDTDMKTSSFHRSRKLIPIQSVNSKSRRFQLQKACVIGLKSLYMNCKRKLHCSATVGLWCAEN